MVRKEGNAWLVIDDNTGDDVGCYEDMNEARKADEKRIGKTLTNPVMVADPLNRRGIPKVEVRGDDPHAIVIHETMLSDLIASLKTLGIWVNVGMVDHVVRNIELGKMPHEGRVEVRE